MRLFSFDTLITPRLIRLVYALLVLVYGLAALVMLLFVLNAPFLPSGVRVVGMLACPLGFGLLAILTRVGAELVLVFFMIRDELAWQRESRTDLRAAAE